jgi:hypothetical protein
VTAAANLPLHVGATCRSCGVTLSDANWRATWNTGFLCRECKADYHRAWRQDHPDRVAAHRVAAYAVHREQRVIVLTHYGLNGTMACVCCAESRYEFLTIDHTGDDGADHRKSGVSTQQLPAWLIARGFPPGFQTLCWNCNAAKAFYGSCPHGRA